MGGVLAFALMLTAAGAIAAGHEAEPVAVSETTPLDGVTRNLGAPAGASQVGIDDSVTAVAVTSTMTESPVTVASSWSMDPLSEDTAASSTSVTPEQVTSSAMVAALGR